MGEECRNDERCKAYTYVIRGPRYASCCLKDGQPESYDAPGMTSGIKWDSGSDTSNPEFVFQVNRELLGECSRMALDQGRMHYQLVGYGSDWACFVFDECVTWDQQNISEHVSVFTSTKVYEECAGNYQYRGTYWGDHCVLQESWGCVEEDHIVFSADGVDEFAQRKMWVDHGCHKRALVWGDFDSFLMECESLNNSRTECPLLNPDLIDYPHYPYYYYPDHPYYYN